MIILFISEVDALVLADGAESIVVITLTIPPTALKNHQNPWWREF